MSNQSGISLIEMLISLVIASIIMTTLVQLYISNKRQYNEAQEVLEVSFDLQWVSDLISDSIRRAGFTPCLGIEQLEAVDRRDIKRVLQGLKIEQAPRQSIQINRMSEFFTHVTDIQSPTQLVVSHSIIFKEQHPILIADCDHAEVHKLLRVDKIAKGQLLTLAKPLMYSYPTKAYIGEWFEEQWFIKANAKKNNSLHYKLFQTEELTPLVHSLQINKKPIHDKTLIEIIMGLDKSKSHQIMVAVRGS
jgi:prepilin-type N-terminal cleavage/methylation domain-containing protein